MLRVVWFVRLVVDRWFSMFCGLFGIVWVVAVFGFCLVWTGVSWVVWLRCALGIALSICFCGGCDGWWFGGLDVGGLAGFGCLVIALFCFAEIVC